MKRFWLYSAGILALLVMTTALAADTHIILKSTMNFFGRDRVSQTEVWIGSDKEYRKESWGISIVRNDLGVRWSSIPAKKLIMNYP